MKNGARVCKGRRSRGEEAQGAAKGGAAPSAARGCSGAVYRSGRAWGTKNRLKEHRGEKTRERKDMSRIAMKPGERGWGWGWKKEGGDYGAQLHSTDTSLLYCRAVACTPSKPGSPGSAAGRRAG